MKKASKFFSGFVSKSKQIFNTTSKKEHEAAKETAAAFGDDGFDSGEDDDLIEIGKHKGAALGAKSVTVDLQSLTGDQIIREDRYAQQFKLLAQSKASGPKGDVDLVRDAIEAAISTSQQEDQQLQGVEQASTPADRVVELNSQTSYFNLNSFSEIETKIAKQKKSQQDEVSSSAAVDQSKYIEFVCIVGFHHSVGSQVEFVYPPLQEDKEERLTGEFIRLIPQLALPDGSHVTDSGYVYFMLRDERNTFHCTSCYRQINADELINKDESVSRTFVQKAVVVLSQSPVYGEIRAKLQPTTEAFFAQRNFKDTQILTDLYESSNQAGRQSIKDISQFSTGLNLEQVFRLPNNGVLTLVKAILLEGRIVVYSHISSRVSSFIYSLVALLPGCSFFKADSSLAVQKSLRFLKQFGLPLHVFASEPCDTTAAVTSEGMALYSLFALPNIDKLEGDKGYLLGTTNQLFLNLPKIKADVVVDLDKFTVQTMSEIRQTAQLKSPSTAISPQAAELQKLIRTHTSYEKKAFRVAPLETKKQPQQTKEEGGSQKAGSAAAFAKFNYRGADVEDINGLVDRNEATENQLRNVVLSYLQKLFCQLALAKQVVEDFQRVYAPAQHEDEEHKQAQGGLKRTGREKAPAEGGSEADTIHMDTCKLRHEESASKSAPSQVSQLLKSDSLDNRDDEQGEETAIIHESQEGFDIIEHTQQTSGSVLTRTAQSESQQMQKRKLSELQKFSLNVNQLARKDSLPKSQDSKTEEHAGSSSTTWDTQTASSLTSPTLQQLKKAQKRRDKALKEVLQFDNRYTQKFLVHWSKTVNFKHWVQSHDTQLLAALSPQYPSEEEVKVAIYYETGDLYKGCLREGKRHGSGFYLDRAGQMTYNGQFRDDKYHGHGTLCSEKDGTTKMYIYDGEWIEGVRNGLGQEVTTSGKYNGEWLEDMWHGQGISVDQLGNMYEGQFQFGKRNGHGKLTRCAIEAATAQDENGQEPQIEIVEGLWENDQLVQETAK